MNLLATLQDRFRSALENFGVEDVESLAAMLTQAQDARFGDYQANCAMPLAKQLGRPPRDVATELVERLSLDDICAAPEVAGPGFINLRLRDEWIVAQLESIRGDERLGVVPQPDPRTFVIDFSSPNVAKPMHVGHIRSTVIGDALCRTLRFLGHHVISDNHLGDWGTQFGMIIYGYRHFVDQEAYARNPVAELGQVYRKVRSLISYQEGQAALPQQRRQLDVLRQKREQLEQEIAPDDAKAQKKLKKQLAKLREDIGRQRSSVAALEESLARIDSDPAARAEVLAHPDIAKAVLQETAKLHEGDAANRRLWEEFLPKCREEIERIYQRLDVRFDEELGESFYHDQLGDIVRQLEQRGLARDSEGAKCVFLEGFEAPMIIQKSDGAYLYATTDLATIAYRVERWHPDAILYVVDFRQAEHFAKLFAAARAWGFRGVEFAHVSFGTVLGEDGRPFKTRSGDTVSLEGLLDEAVARAYQVVSENDDAGKHGPTLDEGRRREIASVVGHGAVKYADLSQNRTSDYVFSYDKMVATQGNTSTYLQYSYARIQNIFAKGSVDVVGLREERLAIQVGLPAERNLALQILRFHEALAETLVDYRPNLLANYLYTLGKRFAEFYNDCPVLDSDHASRASRLVLCDLTARTLKLGLSLLGIQVIDKM